LDTGDIVWVEFDPAFGHEQSGRRPALVLSNSEYNARSSFTIVCPITQSRREWPFHVALSEQGRIRGSVVVDQIKSIDTRRVVSPRLEQVSANLLEQVRSTLAAVTFGPDSF
jgi:mRNA interferase MazF